LNMVATSAFESSSCQPLGRWNPTRSPCNKNSQAYLWEHKRSGSRVIQHIYWNTQFLVTNYTIIRAIHCYCCWSGNTKWRHRSSRRPKHKPNTMVNGPMWQG
jgi:hypothetical protein